MGKSLGSRTSQRPTRRVSSATDTRRIQPLSAARTDRRSSARTTTPSSTRTLSERPSSPVPVSGSTARLTVPSVISRKSSWDALPDIYAFDAAAALLEEDTVSAERALDAASAAEFDLSLAPRALVRHVYSSAASPPSPASRMARPTASPPGVVTLYAPPANLYSHLPHSQMPVSVRDTLSAPHSGHSWSARISSSMSATRLRPTRPYLAPKRPALRVTRPALRSSAMYDESAGRKINPVIPGHVSLVRTVFITV